MSISAITSNSTAFIPGYEKATPAPTSTELKVAAPTDTVTLSSAAHMAAPTGDVDHDGDSH